MLDPVEVAPEDRAPKEEEPAQPPSDSVGPGPISQNPKTPAFEPVLYGRLASVLVALLVSYGILGDGQYPELEELVAGFLAWLAADSGISVAVRALVRPVAKDGDR